MEALNGRVRVVNQLGSRSCSCPWMEYELHLASGPWTLASSISVFVHATPTASALEFFCLELGVVSALHTNKGVTSS